MEAQKPNKPANTSKKKTGINAFLVIILCFIASICMYVFVLGNDANFENGHPTNLLGTVHEGGFVVPIIWGLVFMVIVFTVERFIALKKAAGKKSADKFVGDLKKALESGNVAAAKKVCDDQSGAIGAAVGCAVAKYEEMLAASTLKKEDRALAIRNALDEGINFELPTLQQNMPILFTETTLGTLMGLFGTVLGMIKSFSALGNSGAPDSSALSQGISEALVNTASGIACGALAVITYNYYDTKINDITYKINEAGAAIISVFEAKAE